MPHFTLYYFNGRGRAEICRMLFAAAGVQFTDARIEFAEWNTYRTKMPGSCLPVLEIDTKFRMPESMAIARYLAREFGYHGKTHMDMFRVDYISDCFYEIMHDYMRWFHEKHGRFKYYATAVTTSGNKTCVTHTSVTSTSIITTSGTNTSGMNSSGKNTASVTSGTKTTTANIGTKPSPGDAGANTPPGNAGAKTPPGNAGAKTPPANVGAKTPPGNPGAKTPPGNVGAKTPPGNPGAKTPPGNVAAKTPPGNVAAKTPPGNVGAKTPPGPIGTKPASVTGAGTEYITLMHNQYMDTCRRILPFMERTLTMRNGGSHFFMGEQMMMCDMLCYCCLEAPVRETPTLLSNYPKLTALRTRVASHPKIGAYLKKRCQTEW